jgi:hypothetical protein
LLKKQHFFQVPTEDLHATDSKEPNSDVESENSDDLEMPVLKAEIPWPPSLAAKSAAKADNVAAKSAAKADNVAAKSSAKNDPTKSGGSCGVTSHPPGVVNKVKSCDHVASSIRPLDDRDEQQQENSLLSGGSAAALCDKNYESNEKPKTSEKCYYNTSSTPLPPVSDTSDSEAVSSSRSFGNGKTTEPPSRHKPPSAAGLSDSDSDSDLELLCLRRKKVPTSQQIEGSSEFKLEEENTEQVFDRLVHSSSKGNTAAATKTTATKTTTADKNATAFTTSSAVRHGEKGDKIVASFGDESDQQALRQRREKIQQQQQQSPVKNEGGGGGGSTSSIWGKQIASFDLSDDYVNDYLREQQAKKIETIPDDPTSSQVADLLGGVNATSHRLLSSPPPSSSSHQRQARKVASRAASFDIIPACVPDSIGTEIDDILHSGFITMGGGKYGNIHDSEASQDAVSLSSMTSSMSGSGPVLGGGGGGRSGRRASKRRSGKGASGPECSPAAAGRRSGGKKARQKSTDNLHPNLLPGSSRLFIFIREIQQLR